LPEKCQNYLWAGEFEYKKYEYLYKKGLVNGSMRIQDVPYGTDVLRLVPDVPHVTGFRGQRVLWDPMVLVKFLCLKFFW